MQFQPFAYMASGDEFGWGTPTYDTGIQVFYDFGADGNGQTISWDPATTNNVLDAGGSGTDAQWVPIGSNFYNALSGSGFGKGVAEYSNSGSKDGQYLNLIDDADFSTPFTAVTFEWVYKTPSFALSEDNAFMRYGNGNFSETNCEVNLQQYGSPRRWYVQLVGETTDSGAIFYNFSSTTDQWIHVVITGARSDNARLYINGSLAGASPSTFDSGETWSWSRTNAAIWGSNGFASGVVLGRLGCFRMYNTAMPASSVTDNYNYFSANFD